MVQLLETTLIRVGNVEYARSNKSYGLTTLGNKHVEVNGSKIHFEFRGKSGVEHAIDITDQRLAKVIKQCQELPEQKLFEYVDDEGGRHDVTSSDVNAYLQGELAGQLQKQLEQKLSGSLKSLKPQEAAVMALLQERLRRDTKA